MDNKRYLEYLKSEQWKLLTKKRLEIDNYMCQGCGCKGTPANPLEQHHISYRRIYQENVWVDIVTLCHCCHKHIHSVLNRVTDPSGRHGWADREDIPQVHIYDVGGQLYFKEVKKDE